MVASSLLTANFAAVMTVIQMIPELSSMEFGISLIITSASLGLGGTLILRRLSSQLTMQPTRRTRFPKTCSRRYARNLREDCLISMLITFKFLRENNGYFPVRIDALPEGTVCYPHTPILQIVASGEYAPLCTYLETLLTTAWVRALLSKVVRRDPNS